MRLLSLLVAFSVACSSRFAPGDEPKEIPPWPEVPAAESKLPHRAPKELLERLETALDEWRSMERGSIRYVISPQDKASGTWGWAAFDQSEHSFGWEGERWRLDWSGATVTGDGDSIRSLHRIGERMAGIIHGPSGEGSVPHLTFWSAFPAVPRGLSGSPLGSRLSGGELRALSERVRLDGNECYQFERFTQHEAPINAIQVKHAEGYRIVETKAVQKTRQTLRIAAEPETFRPVVWAIGTEVRREADGYPSQTIRQFPTVTAKFEDFRSVGETAMPWTIAVTEYSVTAEGVVDRMSGTTITVSEWRVEPPAGERLMIEFPDGISVLDQARGIGYGAGAPQAEIDRLLTARAKFDDYYESLKSQPLTELDGVWVAGDPVKLAEQTGKPVKLYLWGLGCGPCLAHLPTLESIYGRDAADRGEVFVALHHHVGKDEVEQVRKFVREKGLTFPVLIDAAGTFDNSPGRLHEHFRVGAWPTEIQLDGEGRYLHSDIDRRVLTFQSPLEERWWGE